MKTRTRLSAFFLALCLLVSMIVPAVYAEEETVKITYDFDYYNVMGGKNLGSNNALNEKCASTIQKNYNNGTFNWFYTFGEIGTEATDVQFRKQGYMRLKGTGWMALQLIIPAQALSGLLQCGML